ncbi:MAG TPA: hypothetical protein VIK14_12390 [Ignavibacteria bacterium]
MKKNDELEELLSYKPSKEQRLMILAEVKETGQSIAEIADRYAMVPLFLKDENGMIEYKNEKMLAIEFGKRFPHRRFVTLEGPEKLE